MSEAEAPPAADTDAAVSVAPQATEVVVVTENAAPPGDAISEAAVGVPQEEQQQHPLVAAAVAEIEVVAGLDAGPIKEEETSIASTEQPRDSERDKQPKQDEPLQDIPTTTVGEEVAPAVVANGGGSVGNEAVATTTTTATVTESTEQAAIAGPPLPESGVAVEAAPPLLQDTALIAKPSETTTATPMTLSIAPAALGEIIKTEIGIGIGQAPQAVTSPGDKEEGTTPPPLSPSKPIKIKVAPKDYGPIITVYDDMDVLSGRGAAVNNHPGNKKFRALCFVRKAHFDLGNHAAKRKLATEIVEILQLGKDHPPSRFLKRRPANALPAVTATVALEGGPATESGAANPAGLTPAVAATTSSANNNNHNNNGPLYYAMTKEQAILKAQQVMRDYKRPDRLEAKMLQQQARHQQQQPPAAEGDTEDGGGATAPADAPAANIPKPHRARAVPSTPLEGVVEMLDAPDLEKDDLFRANPFGVHAHDVLSGRGAYVNGHVGNARLRDMALERKSRFDTGNYTEKRQLASEIVAVIKSLDPPGRFLKKASQQLLETHERAEAEAKCVATNQEEEQQQQQPSIKGEEEEVVEAGDTVMKEENSTANTSSAEATATSESNNASGATSEVMKEKEQQAIAAPGQPQAETGEATDIAPTTAPTIAEPTEAPQEQPVPELAPITQQQQQQSNTINNLPPLIDGVWEELSDDKAIHKACQVMRDISRPDRKYREERKEERLKHRRNNKRRKSNDGGRHSLSTEPKDDEETAAPDSEEGVVATAEAPAPDQDPATNVVAEGVVGMETEPTPPLASAQTPLKPPSEEVVAAEPNEMKEESRVEASDGTAAAAVTSIEAKDTTAVAVEDVVDKALLDSGTSATESETAEV